MAQITSITSTHTQSLAWVPLFPPCVWGVCQSPEFIHTRPWKTPEPSQRVAMAPKVDHKAVAADLLKDRFCVDLTYPVVHET